MSNTNQSKERLSALEVDLIEEDEPLHKHHYTSEPEYLCIDVAAYDKSVIGRLVVRLGHSTGAASGSILIPPEMAREVAASLIACADHLEGGAA